MPGACPSGKRARHSQRQIGLEVAQYVLHAQRIYLQRASKCLAGRCAIALAQSAQTDIAEDASTGARPARQQAIAADRIAAALISLKVVMVVSLPVIDPSARYARASDRKTRVCLLIFLSTRNREAAFKLLSLRNYPRCHRY